MTVKCQETQEIIKVLQGLREPVPYSDINYVRECLHPENQGKKTPSTAFSTFHSFEEHINAHLIVNYLYLCSITVLLKTLTLLFNLISAELIIHL
jgi:hypothetical protein